MRRTLLVLSIVMLVLLGMVASASWKYSQAFPKPSNEMVQLNSEKRVILSRLRSEEKFEPHDYPPLGYAGVATPEEGVVARAAVNGVLDTILFRENGPLPASDVLTLIRRAMKRVNLLETEDRDRTSGYMIEVWYILGFKGATGQFAYGSMFSAPAGYGEPLPPGWKSPREPRPIGRP
ncbi:DUF4844 domain-containing protein [Sphingomonas sp. RB1R13]|uniref:DUF4844 domain-containing protein n=1 Tax=Sphingomonas sp. RB1R13 TaxID=3096159 RepID=UPI003FA74669